MNQQEFLEILHVAERLKDTKRHCTTSKGRPESVAEHSWRISLMAFLQKEEFPDADINKVVSMCLIHDLGECFTGDIPVFKKTEQDRIKEEQELSAWVATLPKGISERMSSLYREMNEQITPEAKLYKALDKLEALIQHNESPLSTWEDHEVELQRKYAWESVEFSEWIRKLREQVLRDTEDKLANEKSSGVMSSEQK